MSGSRATVNSSCHEFQLQSQLYPGTAAQIVSEKIPKTRGTSSRECLRRARNKCVAPASGIQLRASPREVHVSLTGFELGSLESVACGSLPRRAYPPPWSCGREAEGGGLLNRYRVVKPYPGFESLRLRHPSPCPARRHG